MKAIKQLRGHCQYCGSEQAVSNGVIAYHGYTRHRRSNLGHCVGSMFGSAESSELIAKGEFLEWSLEEISNAKEISVEYFGKDFIEVIIDIEAEEKKEEDKPKLGEVRFEVYEKIVDGAKKKFKRKYKAVKISASYVSYMLGSVMLRMSIKEWILMQKEAV